MDESRDEALTWRRRMMLRIVPPVVATVLRLLHATLRYEIVCEPGAAGDSPGQPGIWCFWHRCLLTAACHFQGRPRTVLLISRSFDGELVARVIERLGYGTVRGSSSRAGASGMRALVRVVREGSAAVIPGDGPRGPRYELKPGVTRLAMLTRLPVGCFYMHPERAWVMRSWDALLVPKPFSRVVLVWGRPVAASADSDDEEVARLAVQATLERLRAQAEQHFPKH
jgi:lysophospholipid acyltransferase (LPLAT)-like uncharacterized protein